MQNDLSTDPGTPIDLVTPTPEPAELESRKPRTAIDLAKFKLLVDLAPLALAVVAVTYAGGWMAIQFAHDAVNVYGLDINREAAITCGILFFASSLFIIYPLASLAAGKVLEALRSLLFLLVVAVSAILLSTSFTFNAERLSAWGNYYARVLLITLPVLLVLLAQALLVQYLRARARRTVRGLVLGDTLSKSVADWKDLPLETREAIVTGIRALLPDMEEFVKSIRLPLTLVRTVAGVFSLLVTVQMLSQFGSLVVPTLRPAFGGYLDNDVMIEITDPKEAVRGRMILQDAAWIVLQNKDGVVRLLPKRRVLSVSSYERHSPTQ